jgi:hypothetical protein
MSDKMKNRYEVIELSICECFDVESANLVADALNRMSDD